jgi:ABC-type Fe3+-hydroxamate transport system substrate-binding protein
MISRQFTDQMGRMISINYPPQRIISLVPSQTELLFELGLEEQVVGITKFCIHPAGKFRTTAKIGGTKKLNIDKIRDLMPDLIIGNKEENEQAQIEELMKDYPVWMSDINVLDEAIEMINAVGDITGKTRESNELAREITQGFASLNLFNARPVRVAYFIWKDPYMVAGRGTFINDILSRASLENFSELNRYPQLSIDQIRESRPDVIFLSSEPYPFKNDHINEMKAVCPQAKVIVVDGELFSWYGSRLLHTPAYLRSLAELLN